MLDAENKHQIDIWNEEWKSYLDLFERWRNQMPKQVTVISGEQRETFEISFLSKFVAIRKPFFVAYVENFDIMNFPDTI